MKNTITKIVLTFLLVNISLFANNSVLKTKIENMPMMKSNGIKVTKVVTHNGIHQFKGVAMNQQGRKIDGFITSDFKTLLIGKAYNMTTAKELVIPFDIDVKLLKQVAAYKMGNGKDEYFVFTDPECPYCQKLEKQITFLKKNVTLYTILFPLKFHKNAKSMSRYILSQKDDNTKANAMKEIANKSIKYKQKKYSEDERITLNERIQAGLDAVTKTGIDSTPTILNAKGFRVSPREIIK